MKDYQFIQKQVIKQSKAFWKALVNNAFFVVFPLLLFSIFLILSVLQKTLQQRTQNLLVLSVPFSMPSPALYPVITNAVLGASAGASLDSFKSVALSALGAVVMDDASKVILFSKNQDLRFSMASTTKIMTALVALEYYDIHDVLTVKTDHIEGTTLGFKTGTKFVFEDLLYAMMLPSSNDAALTIAQNYPGGESAFVAKMNEKAQELHLYKTNFADPAGLEDEGDYTTVVDLARLASEAVKNDTLRRIVGTKQKIITDVDGSQQYVLININKLLGVDGVNGIKTGFTDEAGGVLVTSKIEQGHTLLLVVMKSENRFTDTEKLLSLISGKLTFQPIQP